MLDSQMRHTPFVNLSGEWTTGEAVFLHLKRGQRIRMGSMGEGSGERKGIGDIIGWYNIE